MCWGQIIGGAAQAGQSVLQGEQRAATATSNAELLDLKAADALKRGGIAEDIQRNKGAQLMGFQRAAMGASGIQVDSGSGGKVLEQTAAMTELDALNTRTNAMREAWGYSTEAQSQRDVATQAGTLKRLLMPGLGGGGIKGVWGDTTKFFLDPANVFGSRSKYVNQGKV